MLWLHCEMVYFILGEKTNLVKIGHTNGFGQRGLQVRLTALQIGSPDKLKVIAYIDKWSVQEERELQVWFAHLRVHGEWFKLDSELLEIISQPDKFEDIKKTQFQERLKVFRNNQKFYRNKKALKIYNETQGKSVEIQ